jgi:hypothetical protein
LAAFREGPAEAESERWKKNIEVAATRGIGTVHTLVRIEDGIEVRGCVRDASMPKHG